MMLAFVVAAWKLWLLAIGWGVFVFFLAYGHMRWRAWQRRASLAAYQEQLTRAIAMNSFETAHRDCTPEMCSVKREQP